MKRTQNYHRERIIRRFNCKKIEFNGNFQDGGGVADFSLSSQMIVTQLSFAENQAENKLQLHQVRYP